MTLVRSANWIWIGLLLGSLWLGCSSTSRLDSDIAGRTMTYTPGVPNFDLEAIATWRNGQTGVDLYLSIPYASLVFFRNGDQYQARYEAIVQIRDESGKNVLDEESWADTVRVYSYNDTQRFDSFVLDRRLDVEPGLYVVQTTIQDQSSGQNAVRAQRVNVVPRNAGELALSRVRMEGKTGVEPFTPIVSFHLPASLDSLRAVIELYNTPVGDQVEVDMVLVKFESDTLLAAPPYWLSPALGSLGYRGVDYSERDTIQISRRPFEAFDQEVTVQFTLPPLDPGNYRVELKARLTNPPPEMQQRAILVEQQRELSVRGQDFPHVTTLDQMIQALSYLAYDDEMRELRHTVDEEEKRRKFDAFWGSLVTSKQVALNMIKQYYSRVEEANLFFTTHKEGWKTDRGMVYIVMGPPAYVENLLEAEIWHYSFSDRDPLNTFYFEKVRPYGSDAIFENYLLARRAFYERAWIRAIERWRSGNML